MRSIVTLQVGGAGVSIGDTFWQMVAQEHGVNPRNGNIEARSILQVYQLGVFFKVVQKVRCYARTIVMDTEEARAGGPKTALYRPDNVVRGGKSTGNNYAKGRLTDGPELLERSMDVIRREVESIDSLQGFQIIHGIGGGTGSGYCTLLMEQLAQEYPDNLVSNYTIFPAVKFAQNVTEPYNALLSMPSMIDFSHLTFCVDNEGLFSMCSQGGAAEFQSVNQIVALAIAGVTSSLRFPGQLNTSLRKIFVNMCPFPSSHFIVPGVSPIHCDTNTAHKSGSVGELVRELFQSKNLLCDIDLTKGKLLTAAGIFRGRVSPRQVDELMTKLRNKNINLFAEWIPNNIKTSICDIPPVGFKIAGTFLGNTTAISSVFKKIQQRATAMLQKKAYLHTFLAEGMEEQDFKDAREAISNLIKEYNSFAKLSRDSDTGCPNDRKSGADGDAESEAESD